MKIIMILLLILNLSACKNDYPNNESYAKSEIKDVDSLMKYIKNNDVNYLDWIHFSHLNHEDVGSGNIVEVYELEDAKIELIGISYDEKPKKIILIQGGKETILKD